jgi:tetratricopeptide (TPR) repeat protein
VAIERQANLSEVETILDELELLIRWSQEFTLGFVKCNHTAQCDIMRSALFTRLPDKRILTVELKEPVVSLLAEIKNGLQKNESPDCVCVFGLEGSINARREASPVLGRLNHDRDLIRHLVRGALLIWLPDFALDLLARGAPDFWAWRSGVYEFPTHSELWQQDSRAALSGDSEQWLSLALGDKQAEIARIDVLLRTARALPNQDRRSRETVMHLLLKLGALYQMIAEYADAQTCYEESLSIAREIADLSAEAVNLHRLGMIAQAEGAFEKAERLYTKSLEIERKLENEDNVAGSLHQLGIIAQQRGDLSKAQQLFQESLGTWRKLKNLAGIAIALHQLGMVAQQRGELNEAERLYEESMGIERELGNENGRAASLHQLGNLAYIQGDLSTATQHYKDSLEIRMRLGDQHGVASTLIQLARVAENQNRYLEAAQFFRQALHILEKLRSPDIELARQGLMRLESQAAR